MINAIDKIIFCSIFIAIIFIANVVSLQKTFAQTVDETIAFADEQNALKNYDVAVSAYMRSAYFSDSTLQAITNLKIGNCYFAMNDFRNALRFYDLSSRYTLPDSIFDELCFKRATCCLLMNDFENTLVQMASVRDNNNPEIIEKREFYLGIANFGLKDFAKSEKYFVSCIHNNDSVIAIIHGLFSENNKLEKINPRVAKMLSTFIPGAGQMYAGDIKNSVNSFLLNAALLGLLGYTAYKYTVFDSFIAVFPWFWRYYEGGRIKAAQITEAKKEMKRNIIYKKILAAIGKTKESKAFQRK